MSELLNSLANSDLSNAATAYIWLQVIVEVLGCIVGFWVMWKVFRDWFDN